MLPTTTGIRYSFDCGDTILVYKGQGRAYVKRHGWTTAAKAKEMFLRLVREGHSFTKGYEVLASPQPAPRNQLRREPLRCHPTQGCHGFTDT